MVITDIIPQRRSIRTYTGQPLSDEHVQQIKRYADSLKLLFDVKARIEFVHTQAGTEPVKIGTYGWIKGACDYMALIYEEAPLAATAAGYFFEQVILYCTSLGLGTCWVGGMFHKSQFEKQILLSPNEKLRIVSPVGYYAADRKKRWLERVIVNDDKKHATRRRFEDIFFAGNFQTPLTPTAAGQFAAPLAMLRLAPSANNMQEWRVVLSDGMLHFYVKPFLSYELIDIGIAMCHFEQTCKAMNISGSWEKSENHPQAEKLNYVISWKHQ